MGQSGMAKAPLSTGDLGHVLFPSMVEDTAEYVLFNGACDQHGLS